MTALTKAQAERADSGSLPAKLNVADIVRTLSSYEVSYVVVGGFGAQLHGATRPVKDIDLCPQWRQDNLDGLTAALSELDARPLDAAKIDGDVLARLAGIRIGRWRTRSGDIDVLFGLQLQDGSDLRGFSELRERATSFAVAGCHILVASLDDIIRVKQRANRSKDKEALSELIALRDAAQTSPATESWDEMARR